ncbi:hypothetical protein A3Q56_05505 [Intoshia linei]|uniref:Mitochondrial ATP synthase regulatory component factor B n=1 Tax=Intoshia linei TaxID=1819745 RepID=A0A177AXQ9_9BILA|nr:hypothetical protein A3Q56_05505 [Intoshia linei]
MSLHDAFRPYFPTNLLVKYFKKQCKKKLVNAIKYKQETVEKIGFDGFAVLYILENNGQVYLTGVDEWIDSTKIDKIPKIKTNFCKLVGIKYKQTSFITPNCFDIYNDLNNLKSFQIENNASFNDFCLGKLAIFRNTIENIDIVNCIRLSDEGLTSLHRFKKLKRLGLYNMNLSPRVKHYLSLLEKHNNVIVDGID